MSMCFNIPYLLYSGKEEIIPECTMSSFLIELHQLTALTEGLLPST